jgi:uncharacterized cupin superfamily protein
MSDVNLFEVALSDEDDDPPGYHALHERIGPLLGAEQLGLSVYELPPGQSVCPYHYEIGAEEWLIVLTGSPTLRTPAGNQQLVPWDAAFFPNGEEGAHQVSNRTDEPARIAILSNKAQPGVAVYPDSQKLGVWPPRNLFRLADAVDYWDGEL